MITTRTTYHIELDWMCHAYTPDDVCRSVREWLLNYDQDPADWTIQVLTLEGPSGGWPVVELGHPDRGQVEGILECYELESEPME